LVADSKVSLRSEEDNKVFHHSVEANSKAGHHPHHHHLTRHKNHPLYTLLTLEQSEAVFTDIPMFGSAMAAVSGIIQHM
jgi:hypothetical protein